MWYIKTDSAEGTNYSVVELNDTELATVKKFIDAECIIDDYGGYDGIEDTAYKTREDAVMFAALAGANSFYYEECARLYEAGITIKSQFVNNYLFITRIENGNVFVETKLQSHYNSAYVNIYGLFVKSADNIIKLVISENRHITDDTIDVNNLKSLATIDYIEIDDTMDIIKELDIHYPNDNFVNRIKTAITLLRN